MMIQRMGILGLLLAFLLAATFGTAWADRGQRSDDRRSGGRHIEKRQMFEQRHRQRHDYPRPGHVVNSLPRGHRSVVHHRTTYHVHDGTWYRPAGRHFSVVLPPVGLFVPVLPYAYTTVWFGAVPYYYSSGAYYTRHPQRQGYLVAEPPEEVWVDPLPKVAETLYVYPKHGQDEELQAIDRYECHRWAVDQSHFDPTMPGGNVPASQNAARRSGYERATRACLEARDYSVR